MYSKEFFASVTVAAALLKGASASPLDETSKLMARAAQDNKIALTPTALDIGSGKELKLSQQENYFWHHPEEGM